MMRSNRDDEGNCPCLTPGAGRRDGVFPVSVYCRLGNGRARVPTCDELASRCTADDYHDCPGYRRWAASQAWAWRLS